MIQEKKTFSKISNKTYLFVFVQATDSFTYKPLYGIYIYMMMVSMFLRG